MIPNHTHLPVAVHDALYMSPKHSLLLVQTNFDAKLLQFFLMEIANTYLS